VFGRESFVAMTATVFDLSFGDPVKVEADGAILSSESHFLGAAIGHRARVGAGVRIGYGMSIPNDAFLVAPPEDLLRRAPVPVGGPVVVRDGRAVPVRKEG